MNDIFDRIWARKYVFLGTFFVVFTLSYMMLMAIDLLPEAPAPVDDTEVHVKDLEAAPGEQSDDDASEETSQIEPAAVTGVLAPTVVQAGEPVEGVRDESRAGLPTVTEANVLPLSLSIEKLEKTVTVLNPTSRSIADLDAALLDGVVRHPDSATLSQEGNVFILGHSSYLPNVFNKNFQAFNGIQNLAWGDTITVTSADMVYTYRVEKVYRARAQDVTVPIAGTGNRLTLATCNSFGSVDDRYIVEAKRIDESRL